MGFLEIVFEHLPLLVEKAIAQKMAISCNQACQVLFLKQSMIIILKVKLQYKLRKSGNRCEESLQMTEYLGSGGGQG